ncbi:MAG TPA: hypothetical protein VGP17_07040 [Solirubrobacteraceae bacterium]|jgi:hypothetical protein|nr:hypothetical protein [Solirubrobacteraceae bacterium]
MAGSLEGPLAKWLRANTELKKLKDEIETIWPPHKTWPVRPKVDRDGLEHRFHLGELPEIGPEWALWAGEIIFDLRSSLDHLVYQLYVRRYRGKVPREIEKRSQFPIFSSYSQFSRIGLGYIKTLCKGDRQAITDLQPYNAWHDGWEHTRAALAELSAVHNIDKHRKLHVVTGSQRAIIRIDVPTDVGFKSEPIWGAVKSHSHVETWTFTKAPTEVPNHGGAYLQIALKDGNRSSDLLPLLEGFSNAVLRVINRFSDRFPSPS